MASFTEQLEAKAAQEIYFRECLHKKTDGCSKELIAGFIETSLKEIDHTTLLSISRHGIYVVFDGYYDSKHNPSYCIFKDKDSGGMLFRNPKFLDGWNFKYSKSKKQKDIVAGFNLNKQTINIYYIYDLIKSLIKPIGDLKPTFDDERCMISYEWEVSTSNLPIQTEDKETNLKDTSLMY